MSPQCAAPIASAARSDVHTASKSRPDSAAPRSCSREGWLSHPMWKE
jgi:hypothetical protein